MNKAAIVAGLLLIGGLLIYAFFDQQPSGVVGDMDSEFNSRHMSMRPDDETGNHFKPRLRQSVESMSRGEVRAFLKETIISKLDLVDVPLSDALRILNDRVREQAPDRKMPKIMIGSNEVTDQSLVKELRVHDIPLGIALKYICDQCRSRYWVYQGNVYVGRHHDDGDNEDSFLNDTKITELTISDGTLSDAFAVFQQAADEAEFDGIPPYFADRSDPGTRIHGFKLRNVTVGEALREICRQSGTRPDSFEGEISIVSPSR